MYQPSMNKEQVARGNALWDGMMKKAELQAARRMELMAGIIAELRKLHGEDCTVRVEGGKAQAVRISKGPRGGAKVAPLGSWWSCMTLLNCNPDTAAKVMTGVRA